MKVRINQQVLSFLAGVGFGLLVQRLLLLFYKYLVFKVIIIRGAENVDNFCLDSHFSLYKGGFSVLSSLSITC